MSVIKLWLLASVLLLPGMTARVVFAGQTPGSSSRPKAGLPAATEIPTGSAFDLPSQNACQSKYDQFYMAEPGIYAYWALCEVGSNPSIFDYAGIFDLSPRNHSWSSGAGTIRGGVPGPVPDGETADQVMTGSAFIANQNIPLNGNEGTVALWTNADATDHPMAMVYLGAVRGRSGLSVAAYVQPSGECFVGTFSNASAVTATTPPACGYVANQWHRIAFTWSSGTMTMYVDGAHGSKAPYSGQLEDKVFIYRLFPQSGNTGKQMTLAKVSVANRAWNAVQVAADYKPAFLLPAKGGVHVTEEHLGAIHRDVLGYADCNEDLTAGASVGALTSGLASIGVTAIRYANGSAGITADLEDWNGGLSCTRTRGVTGPADNASTQNGLDDFVAKVARPLRASLGFTVNYGTNPPACDSGGDPAVNGARLVAYANVRKHYGIKYWEIGNELYNGGGSETDFHPKPGDGESYGTYEKEFYDAMKKEDRAISIGIPVADTVYSWIANWTLPAMQSARYDAVIFHSYPMRDPITDGQTLYPERVDSNLTRTRGRLLALQTELLNAHKKPDAIWITEWNGDVGGDRWSRQSMGAAMPMFTAMQLAEYMQAGVQYATWWGQGKSDVCMKYNYDWSGQATYSWWDCGGVFLTYTVPFAAETKVDLNPGNVTPAARAFQLLSESGFVAEGEHMVRVASDLENAPWLAAYAATHGPSYALILINRDRDKTHEVPVELAGKNSGHSVQQWTYGRAQYDRSRFGDWSAGPVVSTHGSWTRSFPAVLAPWSVNVFVFDN
jgi:Concanavalin A-like lectin/glucanases superfamily